jgi:aryl-alcohol dehydrogenase-like predicted oxidoreductase
MQTNSFGHTGQAVPLLSFGAQRIVDEHHCSEEEAIKIVNHAIDHGIIYFDTAPSYSSGQSEERLGKALALRQRRDEVWIASKTHDRTRDGSWRLLEESLKRLQTDHLDEWRIHNVMYQEELDAVFEPTGAMKAMQEAREQGIIKYISISGHTNPNVQLNAINRFPFDSVLVPLSVLDHHMYSFLHEFVPAANQKGVAVIGMKVMALGKLAKWYDRALRYSLGLPVSTTIVGMESMEQLERNLQIAEPFIPLSEREQLELMKETIHLVSPETLRWKSDNWAAPDQWITRS